MQKPYVSSLVQLPSLLSPAFQYSSSWIFEIFSYYFCLPQTFLLSGLQHFFGSTCYATSSSRSDNNNFYNFLNPFSYLLCSGENTLTMQRTTLMLQHQQQPLVFLIFFWNNWESTQQCSAAFYQIWGSCIEIL